MESLANYYKEHNGKISDKWTSYVSHYERLFPKYRQKSIRMLEIGVQNGGSLEIWNKYFPKMEVVVGCDIDKRCGLLTFDNDKIKLIIGDANTDIVQEKILSVSENFDIIIDDGSHTSTDIVKTFSRYFTYLNEGGMFIVEDLHCSYWKEFEGGLYNPYSSMAFFKKLADIVNYEHWGVAREVKELLSGFSERFAVEFSEENLKSIYSIEFSNSMCIVTKRSASKNVLGYRLVAGQHEDVLPGQKQFNNKLQSEIHNDYIDQSHNKWSKLTKAPEELFEQTKEENKLIKEENKLIKEENKLIKEENKQRIESLNDELSSFNSAISEIHESTSWKITKPFRLVASQVKYVASQVKNLARLCSTIFSLLTRNFSKAKRVYSTEGFGGLWARFNNLPSRIKATALHEFDISDYQKWVELYDTIDDAQRVALKKICKKLSKSPKISVVMPTYNPKPEWLIEAIDSVRRQIYENWELCIADDKSSDPIVKNILLRYGEKDSRIKVVFREENGHISAASNSAIEVATGEWIALLDHDDVIPEHALLSVAKTIVENPKSALIYSDEDKIDSSGKRKGPYFKSDWNLDMFYCQNMFSHLGVYKRSLVKEVGGFRKGFEGSQDYDLALRCIERVKSSQIIHIPRVLYHWRVHEESTAYNVDAKPYAMIAGERALNEHFARLKISASAKLEESGAGYRTHFALPDNLPLVSIIITTRNAHDLVQKCIESIWQNTEYKNYEIILVDNGSDDLASLRKWNALSNKGVKVIRDDGDFNFSRLNNRAVQAANGDIVALINNDIEVISTEWLNIMVSHASRPGIGAVGARLLYPDLTVQHAGIVLGIDGVAAHPHKKFTNSEYGYFGRLGFTNSFSAITGACLVVKKELYQLIGGLNEENLAIAYNDVDFCLKLGTKGYRNIYASDAVLFHHESKTRGLDNSQSKLERLKKESLYMLEHWGDLIKDDPYYNPNLTLNKEDFDLAWPPRVSQI